MTEEERNRVTLVPPTEQQPTNPFASEEPPTGQETPASKSQPPHAPRRSSSEIPLSMAAIDYAVDRTVDRARKMFQEDLNLALGAMRHEFATFREQLTRLRLEAGLHHMERVEPGTLSVLVADDEEAVRHLLVKVMMRHGARVMEARTGKAALELLEMSPSVDVVLTDLSMPLNGHKLAEHCAIHRPEIGLVITSGHEGAPDLGEHVQFVAKPFGVPEILRAVERAAAERPRDRH